MGLATRAEADPRAEAKLFSGFVRLHVLYHASRAPIFGWGMIEELRRHGYRLSPGTLYPLLQGLEQAGLLRSERKFAHGRFRRLYRATTAGRRALRRARRQIRELFGELFDERP